MNRTVSRLILGGAFLVASAGPAVADEPLPTDPALVTGKLDNGVAYIIRQHATPPGHVSVRMHVSTGSLNESDKQRGLAHYLEHMAFNGSKHFPPGSVVPLFESLGLTFGRDQNASTGMESTTYLLDLADNNDEKIEKALTFMGDVAFGMLLDPKEVDAERNIILNEKRARSGAGQRAGDYFLERLAPGSLYGVRSPIGTEDSIKGVQRPDFVDYYTTRYAAPNITVIVVGDVDTAQTVARIKAHLASGLKAERPADQDPRVAPTAGVRGLVFTDPEIKSASLDVTRISTPKPPTTTVDQLRADMVEQLGQNAFARRTADKVAAGKSSFFSCTANVGNNPGVMRQASMRVSGRPEAWRIALADGATELQRARLHGFAKDEVEDAKKDMIASAEQSATREGTSPSRQLVQRYVGAVASEEPISSAAQRLELRRRLLPTITADEVSRAFASNFDFSSAVFMATLPASGDVPSEDELARVGAEMLKVKPEKDAATARATALMDKLPKAGKIAEKTAHQPSETTSAWLDNGVRVHHRFIDTRKDATTIMVTLAGGTISETAADRGITEAAMLAWGMNQATRGLSSANIRSLMTGKKVNVVGGGGGGGGRGGRGGGGGMAVDGVGLMVSGDPADIETGLQLAYLLLTQPRLEEATFENWKQRQKQQIAQRHTTPAGIASEAYDDAAYPPSEARLRALTESQVESLSLSEVQAWLDKFVAEAPIEVTIVGDMPTDRALELAARYFGALPSRGRIGPGYLQARRVVPHTGKPIEVARDVNTKTDQAVVRVGFYGPDARDVRDVRLMELARQIITSRMVKVIREERVLVYSISAGLSPSEGYPGWGTFQAGAPCEPAKAAALASSIREVFDEFAKNGPTEEEMTTAKKQIHTTLSEALKDPAHWWQRLNGSTYRARSLDDVAAGPEAFADFTAAQVREAFVKYDRPEMRFSIRVVPVGDGSAPAAPERPQ